MDTPEANDLVRRFQSISRGAAIATTLVGLLVLCGWVADISTLKSMLLGQVFMKPNTALAFLLTGCALWLLQERKASNSLKRRAGYFFAALPLVVGLLTLLEYLLDTPLGVDQLLVEDSPSALYTSHPGRMAPNTAANFVLLGLALLLLDARRASRFRPSELLALAAMLIAMLPFVGYLYGVEALVGYTQRYAAMAAHTSATFLMFSGGVLFARPNRGAMALMTSGGTTGILMRVLFPLVVIALVFMGWVRLLGERYGVFTSEVGVALFVVIRVLAISGVIVGVARLVLHLERIREAALHKIEEARETLEHRVALRTAEVTAALDELKSQRDFMAKIMDHGGSLILLTDHEGRIIQFNRECEKTTGYKAIEVLNKVFWEFFLEPPDTGNPGDILKPVFAGAEAITRESPWRTKESGPRWIRWHGVGLGEGPSAPSHCVITGTDITDHRRAEALIKANEENLRNILEHLPVGVILATGNDFTVLYENPRFIELFGYTRKHFKDVSTWWPLAYPDPGYRAEVSAEWNTRIADATRLQRPIEPMEVQITARDGSVRYVCVHATFLGNQCFVTFIDLTERHKSEQSRRLNEQRLETLVHLNQMTRASLQELADFVLEEAVKLTGSKIGYLAFLNEDESVMTMYSWSRNAMQECAIQDKPIVYQVKDTGLWGEAVRQRKPIITNDYAAPNPLKKGCPEGHVQIKRHMNVPVLDEGRIVIVAGVGNKEDSYDDSDVRQLTLLMEGMWKIIQRQRNEDTLKRMRAYLQNVVDSMPSVLVGVDLDGTVIHWNREAERLTGFGESEIKGRDLGDVLPQLEHHLDKVRNAIRKGDALENERFSVPNTNHEMQYFDLMVFPLVANGAQGAVVRLDDVTSRVQIEEMMVQTEKMMSVGGLAAGMAHEINNPLGGILQACQNIERRTSLDLPANLTVAQDVGVDLELVHNYLKARGILNFVSGIRSDGARAARIVADMLAFSRRSSSQFAPNDPVEIVETVLRLAANDYDLKKQYDFRSIEIVRDFEPGLPPVPCDKTKLEQVLLNLVKNAAQAMVENKGKEPPKITIRLHKEPKHLNIEVLDNGPGMDENIRRRIFEPFFTTKEVGIGTGLGLSVSYFIITRQHKGTMIVDSSPGEGAKFSIRLPLKPQG